MGPDIAESNLAEPDHRLSVMMLATGPVDPVVGTSSGKHRRCLAPHHSPSSAVVPYDSTSKPFLLRDPVVVRGLRGNVSNGKETAPLT